MNEIKIVFTGVPGAGKTTAIASISDQPPITTEVTNTDPTLLKERTTVGLDFGQFNLADGQAIRLFGTPGQLRFEFMWRILARDALGLIILIDNSRQDPLGDLKMYADHYREMLPDMNCVVGVGRTLECPVPTIDDFCDLMAERGHAFPVLAVDVRERDDVLMLVEAALAQAEVRVEGRS